MKHCIGFLLALIALGGVSTLPARNNPSDDAEVIDTDPNFKDFKGVIDTGAGYPFLQPAPHAFSFNLGFFDSFEDLLRRLRVRLWPEEIAGRGGFERPADADADDSSDEDDTALSTFGFGLNSKPGNTTSTVKIVDGHRIEVNETVYGDENSMFKVRVVNIHPVDDAADTGKAAAADDDDDDKPAVNVGLNTSTSAPKKEREELEDDDSNERREPLAKKQRHNEIDGNIDEPEVK